MLPEFLETIKKNLFLISLIVLVALLSFQLGRISKTAGQPIQLNKASLQEIFETDANMRMDTNNTNRGEGGYLKIDFRVVVSKNSNKYHFLWCAGAKQIKEENKIYFNSEEEAISAGYTLAGNCSK